MQQNPFIEKLFAVGAHFGYAPRYRHPSTSSFIFGSKGGVELIDLEQTARYLDAALEVVKALAAERKVILFVGGKAEARIALRRTAQKLGQPYSASRWIGGTLTNFSEIKKRLARLQEFTAMRESGDLQKFTKHERLLIDREIQDLQTMFGGLTNMQKVPDALCVIDPRHESGAVAEASLLGLPVIALMNTDCPRTGVSYPIPANDASAQVIALVLDEVARTYADNLGAQPPAALT